MYIHSHTVSTKVLHVSIHNPMYHSCAHEAMHAEHNMSSEKESLHSHVQNMPLHILVRAELIFYALCVLTSRSIFTDANVFPNSYVQSLRSIRDMQIHIYAHACLYTILLLYSHMYSYMHVLTCTRSCTHTCTVYLGKLLEFPSVTRQHLKRNMKKRNISISW